MLGHTCSYNIQELNTGEKLWRDESLHNTWQAVAAQ